MQMGSALLVGVLSIATIGCERESRPFRDLPVASACARNRVALVVPCHRVVARNGDPGGYRWGPERKRRLLAHEPAVAVRRE